VLVNAARIASTLGISTLIESSFEHSESAEVQAGVAGALRNLSVSASIAQLIVEKNAIQSLVNAARIHTTNAIVQAGVAGALRNLSVNEANRKLIIQAGGVAVLDAAATMHADNEKLQIEVAGARRNLLGEQKPATNLTQRNNKPDEPEAPSGGSTNRKDSKGKDSPRGRGRSPMRRPSFGLSSSRRKKNSVAESEGGTPPPDATTAPTAGAAAPAAPARKPSSTGMFGGVFGGLSRRSKSPTPRGTGQ